MTRVKVIALVVSATSLMCIAMCSTAQALPWFMKGGSVLPVKTKFTIASGEMRLSLIGGTIKCTSDVGVEPQTSNAAHVRLIISFHGCKRGVTACQSGATSEVINTNELEGWLFYIKEAAPIKVGMFFTEQFGTTFAEFKCGTETFTVLSVQKGEYSKIKSNSCLAGEVTSVLNKEQKEWTVSFVEILKKQQIKTVNYNEQTFECELETIESSTKILSPMSWTMASTWTGTPEAEIKA